MQHLVTHICDDIRFEMRNKLSLIGIYDESLLVDSFPARLAQLSLFQRWSGMEDLTHVRVEVRGNASPGIHTFKAREFEMPGPRIQLALRFSPIDLVKEGKLEFITYFNEQQQPAHAHLLSVRLPTAEDGIV